MESETPAPLPRLRPPWDPARLLSGPRVTSVSGTTSFVRRSSGLGGLFAKVGPPAKREAGLDLSNGPPAASLMCPHPRHGLRGGAGVHDRTLH